ncbi:MAG: hypothetical protein ACR2RB_08090 [Gammaproteobacteria bacterium]
MIVRRWFIRLSLDAREIVDEYSRINPGFEEVWGLDRVEMAFSADKHAIEWGGGYFTASLLHSPAYPLVTLLFRYTDDHTILVVDVMFDQVH